MTQIVALFRLNPLINQSWSVTPELPVRSWLSSPHKTRHWGRSKVFPAWRAVCRLCWRFTKSANISAWFVPVTPSCQRDKRFFILTHWCILYSVIIVLLEGIKTTNEHLGDADVFKLLRGLLTQHINRLYHLVKFLQKVFWGTRVYMRCCFLHGAEVNNLVCSNSWSSQLLTVEALKRFSCCCPIETQNYNIKFKLYVFIEQMLGIYFGRTHFKSALRTKRGRKWIKFERCGMNVGCDFTIRKNVDAGPRLNQPRTTGRKNLLRRT